MTDNKQTLKTVGIPDGSTSMSLLVLTEYQIDGDVGACTKALTTSPNACTESSWSTWINDRKASQSPLPGEEHVVDKIIPGGDKEDMNATARDRFCTPNHGVITDIQCVTVANETNFTNAQTGQHALSCEVANGFICYNRHVNGHVCLDYKIRLFCNCSSPLQKTTAQTLQNTTGKMTKPRGKTTPLAQSGISTKYTSIVASNSRVKTTGAPGGINGHAVQMSTEKNSAYRLQTFLPACYLLTLVTRYVHRNA